MIHTPITLQNVSLSFVEKTCFENLSARIHAGSHIGLIGRNGSGKTTLLKIIQQLTSPTSGQVKIPTDVVFGYVPQIIEEFDSISGGQRFNKQLSSVLSTNPNVLCLDEPTNHLDLHNRKSLMQMLKNFNGTLIVASHDVELLNTCIDEIWHIDEGKVSIFSGTFDEYQQTLVAQHNTRIKHLESLKKEYKKNMAALQHEQIREAQSKRANKYENDRKLKGHLIERGSQTVGKNRGKINEMKTEISQALEGCRLPEVITPKFHVPAAKLSPTKVIVSTKDGVCGYQKPILENINMTITATEKIAIKGDNGSGKSTLVYALLNNPKITKSGEWLMPDRSGIGYLDQHYTNLDPNLTVFEVIEQLNDGWTIQEIRKHLNDFLFRTNEEVNTPVSALSGGEKARLSLAQIAAHTPRLLILDEMTNNVDLQTREHIINVLKQYPGAMIIISHDEDFLHRIGINTFYMISNSRLTYC